MISSSSLGFQKCFAVTRGFTLPDAVQKCNERPSRRPLHYRSQREINYFCFCFCGKSKCWLCPELSCNHFWALFHWVYFIRKPLFPFLSQLESAFHVWGHHKGHPLFLFSFLSFFVSHSLSLCLSLSLPLFPPPSLSLESKPWLWTSHPPHQWTLYFLLPAQCTACNHYKTMGYLLGDW